MPVHSYNKDGAMRLHHPSSAPAYAPNSRGGPHADPEACPEPSWFTSGDLGRYPPAGHREDDDFVRPRTLWREVLTDLERGRLVANVAEHLGDGVDADVRARAIAYLACITPELGAQVADALAHGHHR